MEFTNINHQAIYINPRNAQSVVMNLLIFGYRQFRTSTKISKLDTYRKLCLEIEQTNMPSSEQIAELVFDQLNDAIKISICFENYMKSKLLLNGYVIHRLNKDLFPDLAKDQYKRPVTLKEITSIREWQINNRIQTDIASLKYQIPGITPLTLGMKELCAPDYLNEIGIEQSLIDLCKPYFAYRNNLHYYLGESLTLGQQVFQDLLKIIDFVNENVVKTQNQLADSLNSGLNKLPPITYQNV